MCILKDVKEPFYLTFDKLSAAATMPFNDFYLSGFEVISLNHNRSYALKTVLSSVVSFDNHLLLIEKKEEGIGIQPICKELGLDYSLCKGREDNHMWGNAEMLFNKYKRVSHVFVEIDDVYSALMLKELCLLCEQMHIELVVLFKGVEEWVLNSCINYNISYIVLTDFRHIHHSFIIARRSSLVETEGASGSFAYDLHRHWQQSLNHRNAVIEPMSV